MPHIVTPHPIRSSSFVGRLSAALLLLIVAGQAVQAQQAKSYTDYRKRNVILPLGALSFADAVHSHNLGSPKPLPPERNPRSALGEPDYRKAGDGRAFLLGCRGSVVFAFTDNAIVDVAGPDLHVFEVGQGIEPTVVALSNDAENWTSIGRIEGGRASIDLADYGLAGRDFRYVRLEDTGQFCDNRWPGADIDAVGAIGSAVRLQLESRVLFGFDKDVLKPDAGIALNQLIASLDELSFSRLTIVGHTDSKGSDDYNQDLSQRRANNVAQYLVAQRPELAAAIAVAGRGESEPVQTNQSDAGRAANRRVEIIVIPKAE